MTRRVYFIPYPPRDHPWLRRARGALVWLACAVGIVGVALALLFVVLSWVSGLLDCHSLCTGP